MPKKTEEKTVDPHFERKLTAAAKEINVRLEKAAKIEDQANNHRLAAAIKLAEAQALCKESKQSFKSWCEANVEKSYDEARKLAKIGGAPEPAKALEDLRAGNARRNQEARARKKATPAPKVSRDTDDVPALIAQMPDEEAVETLEASAEAHGLTVVSKEDAQRAKQVGSMLALDRAIFAFDELSAKDKLKLMHHAATKTGAEVTLFGQPLAEHIKDEPEEAPKKGGRKKKAA